MRGGGSTLQGGDSGVAAQGTAEGGDVSTGQLGPVGLGLTKHGSCTEAVRVRRNSKRGGVKE